MQLTPRNAMEWMDPPQYFGLIQRFNLLSMSSFKTPIATVMTVASNSVERMRRMTVVPPWTITLSSFGLFAKTALGKLIRGLSWEMSIVGRGIEWEKVAQAILPLWIKQEKRLSLCTFKVTALVHHRSRLRFFTNLYTWHLVQSTVSNRAFGVALNSVMNVVLMQGSECQ